MTEALASSHHQQRPADTPREREQQKTDIERGEDIAYTLNHAFSCTGLDILNTPVQAWSQRWLGQKITIAPCCAAAEKAGDTHHHHEHEHGHDHDHNHGGEEGIGGFLGRTGRIMAAEQIGDWASVPLVIGLQRFAPGVMEGIGRGLSYVVGPAFRAGADHSARQWGEEHGLAADSEQVKHRSYEIYKHEMTHLGQAVVWTGLSTGIYMGAMKAMGDTNPWQVNLATKGVGVAVSAGGVLGTRALIPGAARNWDRFTSEHVYTPLTRLIGGTIGLDDKAVTRVAEKQDAYREGSQWLDRFEGERTTTADASPALF